MSLGRKGSIGVDRCCERCFEHPWLQEKAKESQGKRGTCFYCGTEGHLVPIQAFYEAIANLFSDYIPAEAANGGKDSFFPSVPPLVAMQRDWKLFSDRFGMEKGKSFLQSVFKGQGLPDGFIDFSEPAVAFHRNAMSTAYDKWLPFWMTDDALFEEWNGEHDVSDIEVPGTFISQAAEHLSHFVRPLDPSQTFSRARADYIGSSEVDALPFASGEMKGNPKFPASRLNRAGEEIFYCAEAESTAVAEVRPGRGYLCTLCTVTLSKKLFILDLASPLEMVNPFVSRALSWTLDLQRVARNLSLRIAKPMSRGEDVVAYLKPQFIGLVVRAMGVDGIRFSSSLDPGGVNLALFDPAVVAITAPRLVRITKTNVEFESCNDADDL